MKNLVSEGIIVDAVAPSGGVIGGTGVLIGAHLFGVPVRSAAAGETFPLRVEGEVEHAKTSALAISAGDLLYWDAINRVVNKTSSSQKPVGIATTDAANPSATVRLRLVPNVTAAA
jgi:predicted RecA/RadA family phage recombinase